jgi:hypothetical protein
MGWHSDCLQPVCCGIGCSHHMSATAIAVGTVLGVSTVRVKLDISRVYVVFVCSCSHRLQPVCCGYDSGIHPCPHRRRRGDRPRSAGIGVITVHARLGIAECMLPFRLCA